MELEICIDSVESAIAAAQGGADRIELCSALSEGGITPSVGLIRAVRVAAGIQLFVIVRPRGGNFIYSDRELEVMRADILEAKTLGVDGVVFGILTDNDVVDKMRTAELIQLARPLQVTFHRAFDLCGDMDRALEDVIACGADRVLTSGGKADAVKGINVLEGLQKKAGDRICIMAGGGIRTSNVQDVVARTGVRAVHTSLNSDVKSSAHDGGAGVASLHNGHNRFLLTENDVRAFKLALTPLADRHGM
jgi:copper homeostasis protein